MISPYINEDGEQNIASFNQSSRYCLLPNTVPIDEVETASKKTIEHLKRELP